MDRTRVQSGEGAVWGQEVWELTECMGLVRHLSKDVCKISVAQKFVSKVGGRRHSTMAVILAAA